MTVFFSFAATVFIFQHGLSIPRNIIVIGPESSGTRYVSRSLARAITPNSTWNGEKPACWKGSLSHHVLHFSLPWGGLCRKDRKICVDPSIKTTTDLCLFTGIKEIFKATHIRMFVNLTSLLSREPEARAIALVRGVGYTAVSVEKKHCSKDKSARSVVKKEQALAFKIIRTSLHSVPDQVLLVDYEDLWHFPVYTWRRIYHHVGLPVDNITFEPFRNGNTFYRVKRKWLTSTTPQG